MKLKKKKKVSSRELKWILAVTFCPCGVCFQIKSKIMGFAWDILSGWIPVDFEVDYGTIGFLKTTYKTTRRL